MSNRILTEGAPYGHCRRGHRLDASSVLLPRQHLDRGGPAALRRRMGGQDRGVPRHAHPGRAGRPGHGGQRPLPQLWVDNQAQFLVGKAPFFDANWYNEEREFGLPRMRLAGDEELAAYLLREGLDAGFDLAFSNELRIDHSVTCPIITLRPQADLPVVPVYTNIFAPPLPPPSRFVQLGRTIRELIESWPSDLRVAVIGTGHLSLELGGPRQFGPHGPDPEFDHRAVQWIADGDLE